MEKEKILSLCNAVASYVMETQRSFGCVTPRRCSKELIKELMMLGLSREDAVYIENKILD